jgi:hypothetical protein
LKYHVLWAKTAEDELADVWMQAVDKDAVSRAVAKIDRDIAANPQGLGESRESPNHRVHFEVPLGVRFDVHPTRGEVLVLNLWLLPRRRR